MDLNFWVDRWQKGATAFHEHDVNPHLVAHWDRFQLSEDESVFLPLCGKSVDIIWFLNKGLRVIGVDVSEIAVTQLFSSLGVMPEISTAGKLKTYSHGKLQVFVGDIFEMSEDHINSVGAVYDRAAYVAMDEARRKRYADKVRKLCKNAPQMLLTYVYDQEMLQGPPFSISNDELFENYAKHYQLHLVKSGKVPGGLKGVNAVEEVWLLRSPDH